MTQRSDKVHMSDPPERSRGLSKRAIVLSLALFFLILGAIIYFLANPESHHLGRGPTGCEISALTQHFQP